MKENTATFIGHNECYGVDRDAIRKAVISLIEKGVTDFFERWHGWIRLVVCESSI